METFQKQPEVREAILQNEERISSVWLAAYMQTFDILAFDSAHSLAANCYDNSDFCQTYRPFIEMVTNDKDTYVKKVLDYWSYDQDGEPVLFRYEDQILQTCAETTPSNPYEMCLLKYESTLLYDTDGVFTGRRPTSEYALIDNFQHYLLYKYQNDNPSDASRLRMAVTSVHGNDMVRYLATDYFNIVSAYLNVPTGILDARNVPPAQYFAAISFREAHPAITDALLRSVE
jgi:hypothetical protein